MSTVKRDLNKPRKTLPPFDVFMDYTTCYNKSRLLCTFLSPRLVSIYLLIFFLWQMPEIAHTASSSSGHSAGADYKIWSMLYETELPHSTFVHYSTPSLSYFWPYKPESVTVWSAIKDQLCLHTDLQNEVVFYHAVTQQSISQWNFTIERTHQENIIHLTFLEQNCRPSPLSVTKLEVFLPWLPEGTSPYVNQNMKKSHLLKTEWNYM